MQERGDHDLGMLVLRLARGGHRHRVVVKLSDAYGPDRHITLGGTKEITIDTGHSGGWYDIALSTPSDISFD